MQFSMQSVLGMVIFAVMGIDMGLTACPAGYGCFSNPDGCGAADMPCDILVTWMANGASGIEFMATAKDTNPQSPRWAAIGFSLDKLMGKDDILMCRQATAGAVPVFEHYWSPAQSIDLDNSATPAEDSLSSIATWYENGYVGCNFTRAVAGAGKDQSYDLSLTPPDDTSKYYYFFGTGPVSAAGVPTQHEVDPIISTAPVDYTATGDIMSKAGSSEEEPSDSHEDGAGNQMASALLVMTISCLAIFFK